MIDLDASPESKLELTLQQNAAILEGIGLILQALVDCEDDEPEDLADMEVQGPAQ